MTSLLVLSFTSFLRNPNTDVHYLHVNRK